MKKLLLVLCLGLLAGGCKERVIQKTVEISFVCSDGKMVSDVNNCIHFNYLELSPGVTIGHGKLTSDDIYMCEHFNDCDAFNKRFK